MDVHRWQDEPIEPLSTGIGRRMLNGEAMTLAQITLAAGAAVPLHDHPNEQIATVLSGRLRFLVTRAKEDRAARGVGSAFGAAAWQCLDHAQQR